jgi:hypothetical protein
LYFRCLFLRLPFPALPHRSAVEIDYFSQKLRELPAMTPIPHKERRSVMSWLFELLDVILDLGTW